MRVGGRLAWVVRGGVEQGGRRHGAVVGSVPRVPLARVERGRMVVGGSRSETAGGQC